MPTVAMYVRRFETCSQMPGFTIEAWHTVSKNPFKHEYMGLTQKTNENGECEFEIPEGEEVTFLAKKDGFQPCRSPLFTIPAEGIKHEQYIDNIPFQIPSNLIEIPFSWAMNVPPPKYGAAQFIVATVREPKMTQDDLPQGARGCKGEVTFADDKIQREWVNVQKSNPEHIQHNDRWEKRAFLGACITTLAALYFTQNSKKPILSGTAYFLYRALDWLFLSKHERTQEASFYAACIHTLTALLFTKDLKKTALPSVSYLVFRTLAWYFLTERISIAYTGVFKWGPFTNKTNPFEKQHHGIKTTPDGGYMAITSGMHFPEGGAEFTMSVKGPNGIPVSSVRGVMFNHEMWNAPPPYSPTLEKLPDEATRLQYGHRTMYKAPENKERTLCIAGAAGLAAGIATGRTFFKMAQNHKTLGNLAETVGVAAGCATFAGTWEYFSRRDCADDLAKRSDEVALPAEFTSLCLR